MTILNATEARSKLYSLIDETAESHCNPPPYEKLIGDLSGVYPEE